MTKKVFWVDLPRPEGLGPEAEWTNVATFDSHEEAVKFIQENIDGSSKDGTINLITEGLDFDEQIYDIGADAPGESVLRGTADHQS